MTVFVKTGNKSIHDAIKTLAAVCDGAEEKDRTGFNGADAAYGHRLALQPELTPMEEAVAIEMLRKYKGQLEQYGFEVETLCEKFEIEITETAKTEIKNATKKAKQNLEASKSENEDIKIHGLGGELRPFQKAGVAYAIKNQRTFIADEMGLGKTVQGLAAIHAQDAYPALIVCPASLKLNWKRESKKWLPEKIISVFTPKSKPADVEIINYDILKKNLEILQGRGFKSIIFDESHYIKNGKSQRSQAAKKLAKEIDIRIALTGTPILNRPNELINQLDTIGRLDEMGGFWKFAKRYCAAHRGRWGWDLSGSSNLDELNEKLRQTCYVRREKKNVLKELPEKQRTVITIPINNKSEYKSAAKNLIKWLSENESDDAAISAMSAEHLVRIEKLKQLAAEGKMKAAIEWIHSFLETGEKLVIFATHKTVIDSIRNEFHCPTITGSDPVESRQKAVDQFQNDPDCRVIALNIKAGGVGLTLTASSNVVFLEQGWTPGEHDQAEDRCHRIGQENSVNAWYLLAENTIDQDIHDLIEEKRMIVDEATDGNIVGKLIERIKK